MFLERKILGAWYPNSFWLAQSKDYFTARLHGAKFFDFDAAIGWKHLQDDIDHFGANNPLTALVPEYVAALLIMGESYLPYTPRNYTNTAFMESIQTMYVATAWNIQQPLC